MKKLLLALALASISLSSSAATVGGRVTDTSGRALAGVGVSDGVTVVVTDRSGNYTLDTDKKCDCVFVITPSGYEPAESNANRAKFWRLLTAPEANDERADFSLRAVDDSKLAFLTLADIQIGQRINDVEYFNTKSIPDLNATIDSLRALSREPIVITLGDESWDRFWYKNKYALPEIAADMEKINCRVYNTIGNHDHNPRVLGDEHASDTWRRVMGPNYYSFNRGGVHFVVLDNIFYLNEGATAAKNGKRNYRHYITPEQLQWLERDLSLVQHDTPVVVTMHAPLYRANGEYYTENGEDLARLLEPYKTVRVLTGHTHINYSIKNEAGNIRENNYGAVCGTWWWTDQPDYGNNSLCSDGAPAGYSVWTADNGVLAGRYKGVGDPIDYQFRAYDMNELPSPQKNTILVNVWGWAPDWKIEILENGRQLTVTQTVERDPLHYISCEEPSARAGKGLTRTRPTAHFFVAKAKKARSNIEIKVTDDLGRTYQQTLVRPKKLHTAMK